METFAQLIARLMREPQTVNAALNRRDEERTDPITSPLMSVLPARTVNSHTAEGVSDGAAVVMAVPTAVDADWAPALATPERKVWKGETQRFTLKQTLTARDRRVLQADLDAAQLGRNGLSPMQVAQAYFNTNFLVRTRQGFEYAEALTVNRALTSGKITLDYGTGLTLDYGLKTLSRTGAQNYVRNPEQFWVDDLEARQDLGGVARVVMNDVTFSAILGSSPAVSGIVVTGEPTDLGSGNYRYTIRRLSKLADGSYDVNSLYPDGRYAPRVITVIGQTARRYKIQGEGEGAVTVAVEEKLVEDGYIGYHGLEVLGYLHVGPNDIDSSLGRAAQLWKPNPQLVEMIAEENAVPVIVDRAKIRVHKTSLTSA